jgi:hypothetical protein
VVRNSQATPLSMMSLALAPKFATFAIRGG